MVLCQLAFDKSKMDSRSSLPAKLSSWRFGGPLENENDKVPKPLKPVDFVAQYLSVKFLHEMMHVGNCIKRKLPGKQAFQVTNTSSSKSIAGQ